MDCVTCNKPLSKQKIKYGAKYCSDKCSSKVNKPNEKKQTRVHMCEYYLDKYKNGHITFNRLQKEIGNML